MLTLLFGGTKTSVAAEHGQTIGQALQAHGVFFDQPCGGQGTCGKCRVLAQGMLSEPDVTEQNTLIAAQSAQGYRLACQARILGDVLVTLPQSGAPMQIVTADGAPPSQKPRYANHGAAVDIGTTTLCVQLYHAGKLIYTGAGKNPQTVFGADVISRIGSSLAGNAATLQRAVAQGVETLLQEGVHACGVSRADIDEMVITGNTAMLYLLSGRNTASLSRAPFAADYLFDENCTGGDIGLHLFAHTRCFLPGCIGAYLGADIATALLRSGMMEHAQCALLVDIGTNGEIALKRDGALYCCSTAAGPAFEGANIECGSLGVPGAIDGVCYRDGGLHITTIGGDPPASICGSGVIDAVAAFLDAGAIDETGLIDINNTFYSPDAAGKRRLKLSDAVYLTQQDIRAVQLCKAAICAGISMLLEVSGCSADNIEIFYVAGGFGAHLNLNSAERVGLFPAALTQKAKVLGNAALGGAAELLQDTQSERKLRAILHSAQAVDLTGNAGFMDEYVEQMALRRVETLEAPPPLHSLGL